jgi:hypothetical protein
MTRSCPHSMATEDQSSLYNGCHFKAVQPKRWQERVVHKRHDYGFEFCALPLQNDALASTHDCKKPREIARCVAKSRARIWP